MITRQFDRLPKKHFGAVLADPPWRFQVWSAKGEGRSASRHYPTMSTAQIARLPVEQLVKRDAVLFLWFTWPLLPDALHVIDAWGFTFKTCAFCWTKLNAAGEPWIGTGYWTRANSEACLLATRGRPKRRSRRIGQAIIDPRRRHSQKPDRVHDDIRKLVKGPYLELFAREPRKHWSSWGNEI
jgi:N6-adenosine-specific RNA methylase IME4